MFFFFNDTATTEIYTLSLHDALPISGTLSGGEAQRIRLATQIGSSLVGVLYILDEPSIGLHQRDNDRLIETLKHRSEEHTSELQSRQYLVCRLLLEKKKTTSLITCRSSTIISTAWPIISR